MCAHCEGDGGRVSDAGSLFQPYEPGGSFVAVLELVATDGNEQAAAAATLTRRAYLDLLHTLGTGDWAEIARSAEAAYLAVGTLAALARAASDK